MLALCLADSEKRHVRDSCAVGLRDWLSVWSYSFFKVLRVENRSGVMGALGVRAHGTVRRIMYCL